jgi:hypothetical protein
MAYPENVDTEQVFTASHLLATMRNGAANDAATQELEKLVKAIQDSQDSGANGHVTIKVKVSKLKGGETELKVDMKVTSSIPVPPIPFGIYYPDKDGTLHRTDPRQMSLLDRTQPREDGDITRLGRGGLTTIDGEARRG